MRNETNNTQIYDADNFSGTDKATVLKAIIASGKPFTLVHGPAGCGKTTIVKNTFGDNFVDSLKSVKLADKFVILSGANMTKSGEPSKALSDMVKKASLVSFIVVDNLSIINRRKNRIAIGSTDVRSKETLIGTLRAPLNNFSFICKLKKLAKCSEIVKD
jgi:ABC-type phosphate transport system ATPase subunit